MPAATTPADRHATEPVKDRDTGTELEVFKKGFDFGFDDFQLIACRALEAGRGVLLAAPTGAGKTIVGEFAVHLALNKDCKAFYTTPIKALSNQKYQELARKYGSTNVGLLTGDTSINSQAPIVVMTTEVLRNMLYADSETLSGLAYVIMDEVHYLADRMRGAVWEEVIIHLPTEVAMVSLSATVSNAEEFGAWLGTVRGDTAVVVSEHRPIPLWQHILVEKEIVDLFATKRSFDEVAADPAASYTVNPQLLKLARSESTRDHRGSSRQGRRGKPGKYSSGNDSHRDEHPVVRRASRPQVIRALERSDLLPAITFIFSRAACDAAVQQCAAAGLWLTTSAEQEEIADRVDAACAELPDSDKDVLGYWGWRDGLLRGLAAHHAGMLPSFKEVVEDLFADGLVRAVFATETLALGINMPARTVVLEKLEKFNGESHVGISAGEYTQLTGRAGRRGIDVEGHAVVLWQPGTDPTAIAGLASRRTYPLNSSFRPTYNMSINLVSQFGRKRTRDILESSFAQFQADSSVVELAREVRSREESLAGYEKAMTCHLGDFFEYAKLRRELSDHESGASKTKAKQRRVFLAESLASLKPGDVILLPARQRTAHAVVLEADPHTREPRPAVLTNDRQLRRLGIQELSEAARPVAHVRIAKNFNAKLPKDRRNLLASVEAALADAHRQRPSRTAGASSLDASTGGDEAIAVLQRALRAHPCHGCSDREEHARWSERWWKLRRESDGLVRAITARTNTIAKTFDRVTDLLAEYGFVETDVDGNLRPSADGQKLRRVYGEKDLLIALALRENVFSDLDASELAASTTTVVYHAKRDDGVSRPRMPSISLETSVDKVVQLWSMLENAEEAHRLPLTGEPELAMVWPMFKWAKGQPLNEVLRGVDMAAGDFVRWCKQVIDLLDQMAAVPGMPKEFSRLCITAITLIRRGVVAYSTIVE